MQRRMAVWEFKEISFPKGTAREAARQALTAVAETEHWELDRVTLFHDGRRKVRLKRKVYRLQRTA